MLEILPKITVKYNPKVTASTYTMFIYSIVFYIGNKIFCNMRFFLNESKQFQGDRAHE